MLRREVGDWSRFNNRREVSSYTGLCPREHSSGGKRRSGSINKSGNPRVQAMLVEMRLRIATAGEKWQLGEALANVLICSEIEPLRCRMTCARFHHANACRLARKGLEEMGKAEIQKVVEAWQEIRKEIVDDSEIWSVFE